MNEIKAIIVDDEEHNVDLISALVSEYCPEIEIIDKAYTVQTAIKSINLQNPDMVFLDINLKGGTGFDILEETKETDFETVFVTGYDKYAIRAIECAALNYLLKPIVVEELVECVSRYRAKIHNNEKQIDFLSDLVKGSNNRLILPDTYGFKVVNILDIIRCEADGCYTHFFLRNKDKITVSKPMSNFKEILPEHLFSRVHNKHLVNLNFVDQYIKGRDGRIILNDGSEIVVSERKKKEFLNKLKQMAHSLPDKK